MKKIAQPLIVAVTVAAAVLALAACGSGSGGNSAAKPAATAAKPAAAATGRVVIHDFAFAPTTATVKAGTKLSFANEDNASHTATSTTGLFDTDGIDKGKRATITLGKPGTYAYYCAFHPYMKGRIVVR